MWVLYIYVLGFFSWKGLMVYVHAKSVVTSAALCHFCMSPVMVITSGKMIEQDFVTVTRYLWCWTTLVLSAGTLGFQMESFRDFMYKQEGNCGRTTLTVVKNYKYQSNPTTLNEYMPHRTQYLTAVDLLSEAFPWLELSYKTKISSCVYFCVTLCYTCGKFAM